MGPWQVDQVSSAVPSPWFPPLSGPQRPPNLPSSMVTPSPPPPQALSPLTDRPSIVLGCPRVGLNRASALAAPAGPTIHAHRPTGRAYQDHATKTVPSRLGHQPRRGTGKIPCQEGRVVLPFILDVFGRSGSQVSPLGLTSKDQPIAQRVISDTYIYVCVPFCSRPYLSIQEV